MAFQLSEARYLLVKDVSHDLSDVSTGNFGISVQMRGTQLMVEADVSMAGGHLNIQESIDGINWFNSTDLSINFDASVSTTKYLKDFTVFPYSFIRPSVNSAGYGVLQTLRILNPYDR